MKKEVFRTEDLFFRSRAAALENGAVIRYNNRMNTENRPIRQGGALRWTTRSAS
jgi:hypothetical protein